MSEELSSLLKEMTKYVVRERRKMQLPVETVDEHLISCLVDFFEQQEVQYQDRKAVRVDFSQIQNMFNYVTTMRWLKTVEKDGHDLIVISTNNIEKVTSKYNFSSLCVSRLSRYSRFSAEQIQWIPFLGLAISIASQNIWESIKHACDLYSLDDIVINTQDLIQIVEYYSKIDTQRGDQLRDLISYIKQLSDESDEVHMSKIMDSEQMNELKKDLPSSTEQLKQGF